MTMQQLLIIADPADSVFFGENNAEKEHRTPSRGGGKRSVCPSPHDDHDHRLSIPPAKSTSTYIPT